MTFEELKAELKKAGIVPGCDKLDHAKYVQFIDGLQLMGLPATKIAIFAYLGFTEVEAEKMAGAKLEDLCAAVELHITEGVSVQEVLN